MATDLSIIIDDSSDAFYFSGLWNTYGSSASYKLTTWMATLPSPFNFSFEGGSSFANEYLKIDRCTGTSVAFIGQLPRADSLSETMPTVQIDQGAVFKINNSDIVGYRQWFQTPKLSDGTHIITVNCRAGTSIDFAIVTQAVGNQTRPAEGDIIVDNESPSILYSGRWNRNTSRFNTTHFGYLGYPYGNSTHHSSTPSDSFTFRFTGALMDFPRVLATNLLHFVPGTSVTVYGIFSWFNLGAIIATYTIDGVTETRTHSVTSLDSAVSNGGEAPNFIYYSKDDLSGGNHTLIVNITTINNQTFMLDYITYKPWFETLPSTTVMSIKPSSLRNPSSQPSTQVHTSNTPQPAAIVGGVIGLLALGVLVAILGRLLYLQRRKSKQTENIPMDSGMLRTMCIF